MSVKESKANINAQIKINVKVIPNTVWLCVLLSFFKFLIKVMKFTNHKTPIKGITKRRKNNTHNPPIYTF